MKKFEVGKRYSDGAATFEIIGRTAKTIKYVYIHHPGRSNEKRAEEKKAKILNWDDREVFFASCYQLEA